MSRLDKYNRRPDASGPEPSRDVKGVPLTTRISTMFGGFFTQFGALFFTFGMIFWWVFGAQSDVTSWYQFRGELESVAGVVTACDDTGISEGGSEHSPGVPIYKLEYRFNLGDDRAYTGVCYATGMLKQRGDRVSIEYVPGDPAVSRIKGTRKNVIGPLGLFVAIFPGLGLIFMFLGLRNGVRAARMLRVGKLARGRMVDKVATGTKINNASVYKYTFEFEDEQGRTHRITDKTHHSSLVEDEELERLLYNPKNPSQGKLVDTLPGRPKVNEDGEISGTGLKSALLRVCLPVGGVAVHALVGLFLYVL